MKNEQHNIGLQIINIIKKILKRETENADYVKYDDKIFHILTASTYLQKNNTERDMINHVHNCPLPYAGKLDEEHWHEHKQKCAQRNHENNLTLLWNQ